jgi:tryptophan synthase alpha chain
VRDAGSAAAIAAHADGVVVGTALVEALRGSLVEGRAGPNSVEAVAQMVERIAAGVRGVTKPLE